MHDDGNNFCIGKAIFYQGEEYLQGMFGKVKNVVFPDDVRDDSGGTGCQFPIQSQIYRQVSKGRFKSDRFRKVDSLFAGAVAGAKKYNPFDFPPVNRGTAFIGLHCGKGRSGCFSRNIPGPVRCDYDLPSKGRGIRAVFQPPGSDLADHGFFVVGVKNPFRNRNTAQGSVGAEIPLRETSSSL